MAFKLLTMTTTDIDTIRALIRRWRGFESCLLHEVRVWNFLYNVDLVFNYVWSSGNDVRPDVLTSPFFVTLRLVGVEDLRYVGALTEGMRQHPERINWGLSEVANVEVVDRGELVGLSVIWESDRALEVTFVSFELVGPLDRSSD